LQFLTLACKPKGSFEVRRRRRLASAFAWNCVITQNLAVIVFDHDGVTELISSARSSMTLALSANTGAAGEVWEKATSTTR